MSPNKKKISIVALGILVILLCGFVIWQSAFERLAGDTPATSLLASISQTTMKPSTQMIHVPILIYHSVAAYGSGMKPSVKEYTLPPADLDKELSYLRDNGYTVISFDSLIHAMTDVSITLPPKSVVLTFDDGWEDQYTKAFPVLKKYGDTATFFIFTNGPNSGKPDFITWKQLKKMLDAGMDIESHSVSHPYLFAITDQAALDKEIKTSREIITLHLGKTPDLFAYPFGEYSAAAIATIKSAGYIAARADLGWPIKQTVFATTTDALYKLNGIQMTTDFNRFLMSLR